MKYIIVYSEGELSEDAWDFSVDEIDYLCEEHGGESFVFKDGRLWEKKCEEYWI